MSNSSYLFRHVDKQTIEPVTGKISGNIPKWLEGILLRNGPGIQEIGPDKYDHFFDGLALIHRFEIKNGQVTYQNKALDSDTYKKNYAAQRIIVTEFGTVGVADPCKSLFDRFKSTFLPGGIDENITDNCSVNLTFYGDQLYAMTESAFVRRVDPITLRTIGPKTRIRDHVAVNLATAHPHVLENGDVLNMGSNYKHKRGPHYCIIQVPPSYESEETSFKSAKLIAEIPMRWKMYPCYFHSFGMTTDKIVFIEQPYCMNLPKLITLEMFSRSFRDCLAWHPNHKTRIHILPRDKGKSESLIYETDNLFTFHHINAYEEDGNIILDVSAYDNAYFVNNIVVDKVNNKSTKSLEGASARRYVLPVRIDDDAKPGENLVKLKNCNATATVRAGSGGNVIECTPHKFTNWFEFPRINYKYNGNKYNYFYGVQASLERQELSGFPEPDTISKFDIKNGKILQWAGEGEGIQASEPIFVPNPTLKNPDEDDGVVLSALLHQHNQKLVSLLVLDGKTMKELAKVEFTGEGPVSSTFHGIWTQNGDRVHSL